MGRLYSRIPFALHLKSVDSKNCHVRIVADNGIGFLVLRLVAVGLGIPDEQVSLAMVQQDISHSRRPQLAALCGKIPDLQMIRQADGR